MKAVIRIVIFLIILNFSCVSIFASQKENKIIEPSKFYNMTKDCDVGLFNPSSAPINSSYEPEDSQWKNRIPRFVVSFKGEYYWMVTDENIYNIKGEQKEVNCSILKSNLKSEMPDVGNYIQAAKIKVPVDNDVLNIGYYSLAIDNNNYYVAHCENQRTVVYSINKITKKQSVIYKEAYNFSGFWIGQNYLYIERTSNGGKVTVIRINPVNKNVKTVFSTHQNQISIHNNYLFISSTGEIDIYNLEDLAQSSKPIGVFKYDKDFSGGNVYKGNFYYQSHGILEAYETLTGNTRIVGGIVLTEMRSWLDFIMLAADKAYIFDGRYPEMPSLLPLK